MRPPRLSFAAVGLVGVLSLVNTTFADPQTSAALTLLQSDEPLGSTMTLEQMQQRSKSASTVMMEDIHPVEPAGEPVPAMKYRLYPARWQLQSGSALMHYNRAVISLLQLPADLRSKFYSEEWRLGIGDNPRPSQEELGKALQPLDFIFAELHQLALSEDFSWDHRLRHLSGIEIYTYNLNDVQEVRGLGYLLQVRVRHQLLQADFEGAISSIADGIRLAEFVGQGESLIQKLVGFAIQAMMQQSMLQAIETPGCPNLYWAMASIPRPLNEVGESISWELNNFSLVLPALAEAETADWTAEQAAARWQRTVDDLMALGFEDSGVAARSAVAAIAVTQVDRAKQHLLDRGVSDERVSAMPGLQAVLAMTAWELRNFGDHLEKASLLPPMERRKLLVQEQQALQSFQTANRTSSLTAIISGLLFFPVANAAEAEIRRGMELHRLLTLEAIRMHVDANGQLPANLKDVQDPPAFPDPYTGQPFQYSIAKSPEGTVVTLKSAGPEDYPPMQSLAVRFSLKQQQKRQQ